MATTSRPVPTYPTDRGTTIDAVAAAETMFGTGSSQHLAAIARYTPKET